MVAVLLAPCDIGVSKILGGGLAVRVVEVAPILQKSQQRVDMLLELGVCLLHRLAVGHAPDVFLKPLESGERPEEDSGQLLQQCFLEVEVTFRFAKDAGESDDIEPPKESVAAVLGWHEIIC